MVAAFAIRAHSESARGFAPGLARPDRLPGLDPRTTGRPERLLRSAPLAIAGPRDPGAADGELLRHAAVARYAGALRRFRPHQPSGPDAGVGRCGERAHRKLRVLRQHRAHAAPGALHGLGRAAAGLSGRRSRWRVLLGRRVGFEHAALLRTDRAAAGRCVDIPGRSVERGRRPAQGPVAGGSASEGPAVLESDPPDHPVHEAAAKAPWPAE